MAGIPHSREILSNSLWCPRHRIPSIHTASDNPRYGYVCRILKDLPSLTRCQGVLLRDSLGPLGLDAWCDHHLNAHVGCDHNSFRYTICSKNDLRGLDGVVVCAFLSDAREADGGPVCACGKMAFGDGGGVVPQLGDQTTDSGLVFPKSFGDFGLRDIAVVPFEGAGDFGEGELGVLRGWVEAMRLASVRDGLRVEDGCLVSHEQILALARAEMTSDGVETE